MAPLGTEGREGFDIVGAQALHIFAIVFGITQAAKKSIRSRLKCQGTTLVVP
jgi:hypothetical protein